MVTLKSMPTEVSEYIELPDMGELILMPFFHDTDIDLVYKYGTDFQRKLLSKVPLRGDRKYTTVLSEVKLLTPQTRSCTAMLADPVKEWHIDNENSEMGAQDRNYWDEEDVVHLMTNNVSSMTEFLSEELVLDLPEFSDYHAMLNHFCEGVWAGTVDPKGIKMPPNRIVTFLNHMHRATNPTGAEFKYMLRVVETDRQRPPSAYDPRLSRTYILNSRNENVKNIDVVRNKIEIFVDRPAEIDRDMKILPIEQAGWEHSMISFAPELENFTPKHSIMLLGQGDYSSEIDNKALLNFFDNMDKAVTLIGDDGSTIEAILKKNFLSIDRELGSIYGTHVLLNSFDIAEMKHGINYKIVPRNNTEYKLELPDTLVIQKPILE